MSLIVLSLLCLLQVRPSSSQFVFESQLIFINTIDFRICDSYLMSQDVDELGACEPILQVFCLREGRSTQSASTVDCPLGRNNTEVIAFTPSNHTWDRETRPGLPDGPVIRTIMSQQTPWPGAFQLYIKAGEVDPVCSYCDSNQRTVTTLDNIFINRVLEVNADFTPIERYNGTSTRNRVVLDMRFRVMCQQDYYGANCTRFCVAQNDSVNGYYTCNSDGSFQCQEGFRNPDDNCTEGDTNIDDCASATCPSNSVCVDGDNTFECTYLIPTGRPDTVAIDVFIGVVLSAALIIGILIIVIVALSVVFIKGNRPHKYTSQEIDKDIEMKPNEVYELVTRQTRTTSIEMKPNEVYGFNS